MMNFYKIAAVGIFTSLFSFHAFAMDEELLNTRANNAIPKYIEETKGDFGLIQARFSKAGTQQLDDLWDSRQDLVTGVCNDTQNDCRVTSVFRGSVANRPVVMLPGLDAYRKMYIEEVYDLLQNGYGPIYISDFTGTGDSFKEDRKPGEASLTAGQLLSQYQSVEKAYLNEISLSVGQDKVASTRALVDKIPFGVGYIKNFHDYDADIENVMDQAIKDFPTTPILVTSLSMTGLSVMLSLANQNDKATWINHVDRIVLESPMIRTYLTKIVGGMLSQVAAQFGEDVFGSKRVVTPDNGFTELANKALGRYNPDNVITHSANRIALTDSMRVWSGHETAGATFSWAYQEVTHQYSMNFFDSLPFITKPLNSRTDRIRSVLNKTHVPVILVSSLADNAVDTQATLQFFKDLKDGGLQDEVHICIFKTARHQIDIESDKYRESFMSLLYDQQKHIVKPVYGVEPRNELLNCETFVDPNAPAAPAPQAASPGDPSSDTAR